MALVSMRRGYFEHCHKHWHQLVRIIIIILKSIIALHNLHNISPSLSQLSIIDHSKACQCQGRLQDFAHESWQAQHLLHGSKDQVLPQDWVGWISNCPVISCLQIISNIDKELILTARWLRLKCEELGSRYRMPSRAEIAKMGGDDDREDKERVMAGFLSGSVNVR